MFELLIWLVILLGVGGALYAYEGSRDVFHPLMYLVPMMIFLYGWMPHKLSASGGLDGFFQVDQLEFVQAWNAAGMLALIVGCLSVGARVPKLTSPAYVPDDPGRVGIILARGGMVAGLLGLAAWSMSIINVGGLTEAFSRPYSGGWDDSGYIRDGSLMMFPGFVLTTSALLSFRPRITYLLMAAAFISPWMIQAVLTSRRGPTFMISVVLSMTWYLNRRKRPPLVFTVGAGAMVGLLMLFLVSNRGNIYLGSDQELTAEVSSIVEKPDTGNEYIYGAGSMLSAEYREVFYWGKRYLAQIVVRPIPSAIWPDKYEDFGVGELTHNAGTGEGLTETLGWEGANGAAPGIIADLWLEFRWFSVAALWLVGVTYGLAWRNACLRGGPWVGQYVILSALSVYLVMQTIEAVVFRLLLMSIPVWLSWYAAGWRQSTRATQAFAYPDQGMSQPDAI